MKPAAAPIIGVMVATAVVGGLGGWAGVELARRRPAPEPSIDQLLHHQLNLTAAQRGQLAVIEDRFAATRGQLEARMRAANSDLAQAIAADHAFGAPEQAAIERFHVASEALQEATIAHVLTMRTVLTATQAARFDGAVSEALAPAKP